VPTIERYLTSVNVTVLILLSVSYDTATSGMAGSVVARKICVDVAD